MVKSQTSIPLTWWYAQGTRTCQERRRGWGGGKRIYHTALHMVWSFQPFLMQPYASGRVTSRTRENGLPKVLNPRLSISTPWLPAAWQDGGVCAPVTGHTQAFGEQHTMDKALRSVDCDGIHNCYSFLKASSSSAALILQCGARNRTPLGWTCNWMQEHRQ